MNTKCKNKPAFAYVQGNDVLLKLWLWEQTCSGSSNARVQTTAFPFAEAEDVQVIAVGVRQMTLAYSQVQGEENCLAVELPSSLPSGVYAICIRCQMKGRNVRSYESPMFAIVGRNSDADITFARIGDTRQAEYSMEIQMVPSAVARGANAYELWLEQGHEGTIDDFLDYYIAKLVTEEEDGLMSHEDKILLDAYGDIEVASKQDVKNLFDDIFSGE